MREVSDAFLLLMAEVSATLIGLFLVGILFLVEAGFRQAEHARRVLQPYNRSGTRIVLLLFALPLALSLTLVVLEPIWSRLLFALFCVALVAANVDTLRRIRPVLELTGSGTLLANELAGTACVVLLVILPWALGGFHPTREDLTWAILLSFAAGFLSLTTILLSVFDTVKDDAAAPEGR
jgi:hypothetical protein